MTRDLRTLIYLLNLELREECSRTLGWNPAGAASGCGEQQSKRMQSGSSSRSGCDREQQLKQTQAAASVQQQLKRAQSGSAAGSRRKRGATVEAMQSGPGAAADLKRTQVASSS